MPASLQPMLDFLAELRFNNNREWFNENRKRYDQARAACETFVGQVISRFGQIEDLGSVTPEQTMFRINRDTRFSPDKTPYKIAVGILLGKEGRKSTGRIYYVHLQPDGESFIAGGVYMVSPQGLEALRRAIAEDSRPLRALINSESFNHYFGKLTGEQVKTAPKGYSKTHPDIDLLRYKQFLANHPVRDEEVLAEDFVDHILEVCQAMKPFNDYLYGILDQVEQPVLSR